MTQQEIALQVFLALVAKSGVREWEDQDSLEQIADSAVNVAAFIYANGDPMTISAAFREQTGTPKVWKSSGGDGAITLVSLANGSYREGAKIDLGATRAQIYAVYADIEFAATPTAGSTVALWANPSSSATAATDNRGGCSGTDAAYTGYSSNAAASVLQLPFIGNGVTTAQATTTVQKMFVGYYAPPERYVSLIFLNGSGAAVHSSDANCKITITPVEFTQEAS